MRWVSYLLTKRETTRPTTCPTTRPTRSTTHPLDHPYAQPPTRPTTLTPNQPPHYDLKRLKNGQNPKKINFSKIFWKLHFYLSRSLSTYRKCRKSVFSGSGWLDGSKMTFFDPKMHRFAIFWWFWVQNHKFTNSAAFGHCLNAHISIFIHTHLRIKNIFLPILAH